MTLYSPEVERLLSDAPASLPLSQTSLRPAGGCAVQQNAGTLFPVARQGNGALAGLLLRLECWTESHNAAQEVQSVEGSYWHGILHRIEPDAANAAYWFRRVGQHVIFPELFRRAEEILKDSGPKHWHLRTAWDPFLFIEWCDEARKKGGQAEAAAVSIQMAEWELLFAWCASKEER